MICPECEEGTTRLQLSQSGWSWEGFFLKSLSGFHTVPCPACGGTGKVYHHDEDDRSSQNQVDPNFQDGIGIG